MRNVGFPRLQLAKNGVISARMPDTEFIRCACPFSWLKFLVKQPTRKIMKSWVGIVMALAAAVSTQGCEQSRPLEVAAHVWPGYELMYLAKELGWLDPQEVRLAPTTSATESIDALIAGNVDAAALTLDEVLSVRAQGIPLAVVMVFNVSAGADVVLVRPDAAQPRGLKGLRVGYEQGAVGALMLQKALSHAGLGLEDIIAVDLPPSRHLAAWDSALVDAIVTYEPVASQLQAKGATVIFDSRQAPNLIVDVLAVRSDRLNWRHSDPLRTLLGAHFRALAHFQRNPQDAAYRMAPRLSLGANEVSAAFGGLVLPGLENNHRLLGGETPLLLQSVAELSSLMRSRKLLPPGDSHLDHLIDDRFLPPVNSK